MQRFEYFIEGILQNSAKKRLVLFVTLCAFLASIAMFPTKIVLAKMLPSKSTNTFSIYVDLPNGSSYLENQTVNQCVVKLLQKEKEVEDIEVYSGMGSPLDYAGLVKGSGFKVGEHLSEIVVNLSDAHQRDERSYLMVHRLRPLIQNTCETIVKGTNIKMIEQPAGPPTLSALVVELYGENDAMLRSLAEEIKLILSQTKDLVDVDILHDDLYERYELIVDKEKALRSQVSLEALHSLMYLSFEGMAVAYKNSEFSPLQIPIFLVLNDSSKMLNSLSLKELEAKLVSVNIPNRQNILIPLNELVHIKKIQSTPAVMSKNLQKMVTIVAEADLVSQVYPLLEVRNRLKEVFKERFDVKSTHLFDLSLRDKNSGELFEIKWDGEMKVTMDTFRDLGGAFVAALVLIFLLMVVYYKSFAIAGIVLLGSFLSIIGVIMGHWVMDLFNHGTFFLTATSLIGFISLMGISSRNSLLLIDFSMTLMRQGVEKKRAIAQAASTRAKPIFLTAAAIILASTLLASDPIFGGLGVALIFGTIAAVIVSLVVVPVLMDDTQAVK